MAQGRIVDIERKEFCCGTKVDGIKRDKQNYYDNSDKYYGSNGTYMTDLSRTPYIEMKVVVYGNTKEENRTVTVDIRDDILRQNNMKKVSSKLLSEIKEQNEGKKVNFEYLNGELFFPEGELNLKRNSSK